MTENSVESRLKRDTEAWASLGLPNLMQQFVLRNGHGYTEQSPVERMMPNVCFSNAAELAFDQRGIYTEGYAWHPKLPILIHHAWVVAGGKVLDPTWAYPDAEYFGVQFPLTTLRSELLRNGVYGLLDLGGMANARLMFDRDPELKKLIGKEMAQ